MIIDCHGHFTTSPEPLRKFREDQKSYLAGKGLDPSPSSVKISDDEIREAVQDSQLKQMELRGTDVTLFSPIAGAMAHHIGNFKTSQHWAAACNDLICRVTQLYPQKFIGVCQLPQSPRTPPADSIAELERCVLELGFVSCNLNPDPTGGYYTDPPLTDPVWYPLYEKMVELDVPAMIHMAGTNNKHFHGTGSHYLNGDTSAFMQFLTSDLFKDFPTLKFIIPHAGGAIPYHWGRYRGMAQQMNRPPLEEHLLNNVFFDTCVYHQPGIDLLFKTLPIENILFASEMIGAVRGIDPEVGHYFDDTKRYIDKVEGLSDDDKYKLYEGNARRVYGRLDAALAKVGLA